MVQRAVHTGGRSRGERSTQLGLHNTYVGTEGVGTEGGTAGPKLLVGRKIMAQEKERCSPQTLDKTEVDQESRFHDPDDLQMIFVSAGQRPC